MDTERGRVACRAEFMIEPFVEGAPPDHVQAALEAVRAHGLEPEMGPFGSSVQGEANQVIAALTAMLAAAYQTGASRVSIQFDLEA